MNSVNFLPNTLLKLCIVFVCASFLVACSDPYLAKYKSMQPHIEKQFSNLSDDLTNQRIRNAMLLTQYAAHIKNKKPQYAQLLDALALDATDKGPIFTNLKRRFDETKTNATGLTVQEQYSELLAIKQALEPDVYNDMLSDPVNVMADLSEGAFSRVSSISKSAEARANPDAKDFGAGSQLIGNPGYGQWTTGSNGLSFWEWYGMYSLLSNVMGGGRSYYNDWSYRRGYSYYNDYGRNLYSSRNQLKQQDNLYQKTANKFAEKGKRFDSPYAKTRTGSSTLSNKSYVSAKSDRFSSQRTASSFGNKTTSSASNKKTSANSSKLSNQSGSLRSGNYRTSGGLFGGK